MELAILVEPANGQGYRARCGEPFVMEALGETREEALKKLRAEISRRVAGGAQIVGLEVGGESDSPIAKFAGWLEDDPLYEPWQAAIAEYRRQRDESP
jgi:hypothetical protein